MPSSAEILKKYKKIAQTALDSTEHRLMSLGTLGINTMLGRPRGIPQGRIIQLVGNESTGKSTLCYEIGKHYSKQYEEPVAYMAIERGFDPDYARRVLGDSADNFIVFKPDTTEETFQTAENLIADDGIRLVIIDSVAAMVSGKEYDKDYDDPAKVAATAGLLTRFINRMVPIIDNRGATIIFVNQFRANFSASREERIPFGARSLRYANAISIELAHKETKGNRMTVIATGKKNKLGAPRQATSYDILFGEGIDHASHTVELACLYGVIRQAGAYYYYGESLKAQGLARAVETFPLAEVEEKTLAVIEEKLKDVE